MALHRAARVGFSRGAASYERGRPDYPYAAVAFLAERLGLAPGKRVVDLGAGTGKLSRQLLGYGVTVIAVEPVREMAEQLLERVPGVEWVAATAEQMGLPSGTADALACGQSFHWFANLAAVAEIHRVLQPGGWLGLIWNRRDTREPVWVEVGQLLDHHRHDTPDHSSHRWREALDESRIFGPLQSRTFPHLQRATPEQLVDRMLSLSYVAQLPDREQAEMRQQLVSLAERFREGPDRPIVLPYRTEVFACRAT